jgi:anti-sigma factor RsiW
MADGSAITCQEVVEVITDYLEGALPPERAAIFEAHLGLCDGCRWYLDQMRTTIAAAGRIEDDEVPAELRATVLAAFRASPRSS